MPTTTDPNDPRLGYGTDDEPRQQNEIYLVLSEEERAKGFIRPVRRSYKHVGKRTKYPLRDLTDEEKERLSKWNYVKKEVYPESESPQTGKYWTQADLATAGLCARNAAVRVIWPECIERDYQTMTHYDIDFKLLVVKYAREFGAPNAARVFSLLNRTVNDWLNRYSNVDIPDKVLTDYFDTHVIGNRSLTEAEIQAGIALEPLAQKYLKTETDEK